MVSSVKSLPSVGGWMERFIFIKLKEMSSHSTKKLVFASFFKSRLDGLMEHVSHG